MISRSFIMIFHKDLRNLPGGLPVDSACVRACEHACVLVRMWVRKFLKFVIVFNYIMYIAFQKLLRGLHSPFKFMYSPLKSCLKSLYSPFKRL